MIKPATNLFYPKTTRRCYMGMDVYGLNPKLKSEKPEIDWSSADELAREQYFEALGKFESDNPGYYFRNNVWWWRPLWDYVTTVCDSVMTDYQKERGEYNEGYEYDAELTAKMVELLDADIANNGHHQYEKQHLADQAEAKKQEESGEIDKAWVCSYPFDPANVEEFVNFLRNSGGFTVL